MRTFGSTDIGLRRELNEDSYVTFQNDRKDWIGVVCDGIGGSAAGEVASRIAVETIQDAFKKIRF